jgi:cephalosporin-C deacetylase-like acetyl esterase
MGPAPETPCPLDAKVLGDLKRPGYRIERLVFQTRPDVWVTANAYVPVPSRGRLPAVLCVHGHWAGARRDPVVQARCLGLVKLGFFVLAVDAFGSGERYTRPAPGTYHGGLYGSTLWPAGQTMLGVQVYDNGRAVDYLRTRPEVDVARLGITGASGGGNQTMYAGALDDRFAAVVPVCSVGTYQAYLHAACCVCEVLPGALRFTEEGDVLGMVCPRALLVITAARDALQFSPPEVERSVARAREVFRLYGAEYRLRHALFDSGHDYSRPMREAMYGWMTRWLKDEGKGAPVAEPAFEVEKPQALACYPDGIRPAGFLFPPAFAAREAHRLLARWSRNRPDHVEEWESTAVDLRTRLRRDLLGDFPTPPPSGANVGEPRTSAGVAVRTLIVEPEPGIPVPVLVKMKSDGGRRRPACVVLHLEGKSSALEHPVAAALLEADWVVVAPDLRGTGETRPANDSIVGAVDHNSAEHAVWIGRPLLGQWLLDVLTLIDSLGRQPRLDGGRLAVAGLGPAGVVALCAAGLLDDRIAAVVALDAPVSYVTDEAYGPGMRMGLLAPGILRYADIPQLAALAAPRRLVIAGGMTPGGEHLGGEALVKAFAFTGAIYRLYRAGDKFTVRSQAPVAEVVASL